MKIFTQNIKSIFFSLFWIVVTMPISVSAQLQAPENNHGLATARSFDHIIYRGIYFLLEFLASLAILMIVISGIMYITSGGDQTRVEAAKNWLTYAVVGLVVALLGWVIVRTVSTALGAW